MDRVHRVLFAPRELPPLAPDVSQDHSRYPAWARRREQQRRRSARRARQPLLGLILIVADESPDAITMTLGSLRGQTATRWRMAVVVPDERATEIESLLRAAGRRLRRRASVLPADARSTTAARAAVGIGNHQGAVALLFPGDVWAPDAVACLAGGLGPLGTVYADEDRLQGDGSLAAPRLKPGYSPDFLTATGYVGRPLAMDASVAQRVAGAAAAGEAATERDVALVACGAAESVVHVPEVLCHRFSPPDGSGPQPAATPAVWPVPPGLTATVLIPFRDGATLLRACVDSITATTGDLRTEFVLIDNGSTDPETMTLLDRLAGRSDVILVRDERVFNWAALNNVGARAATGDVLVFVNNDIEVHRPGWLHALCGHAVRPEIGAVGARLLYPDGRLQHCGLVLGLGGAAGHPLAGLAADEPGYLQMATATRECSAVTGACLATRRAVFDELGGFDESLGVDLNDVDYCLRAGTAGYRTIFEPRAELTHYESPSRGTAGGVGDIVNFVERWRNALAGGDPYYSPHLTRADGSCALAGPDEADAWERWYAGVRAQ
ncbi:MAG TPA: glycosyltransferase family 2 protein [Acidimicrobiales bacterium]|nr:glycosyltransferase family 2 protein [Acidimicrobiales bacterium]